MNYGELKEHFKDVLNRGDITDAQVVRFIDQGLARIQRQLRTPASERTLEITITAQTESITLPADFIELISIYHGSNELNKIPMRRYRELSANVYSGSPQYYTRQGSELFLYPQPSSGTLVLYYHGEFNALVNDTDENIISNVAPDLVIYAALTYGSDFYMDERSELFEAKFNQFLLELQEQANDQEMNGGTLAINPSVRFDY